MIDAKIGKVNVCRTTIDTSKIYTDVQFLTVSTMILHWERYISVDDLLHCCLKANVFSCFKDIPCSL